MQEYCLLNLVARGVKSVIVFYNIHATLDALRVAVIY